jgi:SAM-dependent methyltransferase
MIPYTSEGHSPLPKEKEWFENWFDSPAYHILYQNRDFEEARRFLDQLERRLAFRPDDEILDVACGKGRFSVYLNQKGYRVTGVDISGNSIREASRFSNERLRFLLGDMRDLQLGGSFDVVLNMFTSFGYFASQSENERAVCSMAACLKEGGVLVLDFLNTVRVLRYLPSKEMVVRDGIRFDIYKHLQNGFILKEIDFVWEGKRHHVQERVKALEQADFERLFSACGLEVEFLAGNYLLEPYSVDSERMIFFARKKRGTTKRGLSEPVR